MRIFVTSDTVGTETGYHVELYHKISGDYACAIAHLSADTQALAGKIGQSLGRDSFCGLYGDC